MNVYLLPSANLLHNNNIKKAKRFIWFDCKMKVEQQFYVLVDRRALRIIIIYLQRNEAHIEQTGGNKLFFGAF